MTTVGYQLIPATRSLRRWQPWTLIVICGVSALLYSWGIGSSWGNPYYSAAVKSMSRSVENFLFGSLDAAGVITVDKPPMALWSQVLSVKLFGYNPFAVLFPQVVAGVAAVFLLHRTVRRWAGESAALIAALVLALSPVTVVVNRGNNPDTLLVLLVVAAAYAMTRAIERDRSTGWLAWAALLVGFGFLTKMLQAWMVLPAFTAAYLVGSRASGPRKAVDLAVAAGVLLLSSFWWVGVTAWWPSPKPYVGGSTDGSAWNLVFSYNGFGRIFGSAGSPNSPPGRGGPGGGGFSGESGLLRMFNDQLAGQISWLLPLCVLVLAAMLVAGLRRRRGGYPTDRRQLAGWVLWGGWLAVVGMMLSFAQGVVHPYYTTMMAPAVGAVVGAGVVRFWRWYREPSGAAWLLLPIGVVISVAWAFVVVARDLSWNPWAGCLAVGFAVAALVVQVLGRLGPAGLALGLAAVLAVPAAWSALGAVSGTSAMGGANPMAGPSTGMSFGPHGMRLVGHGTGMPPAGSGSARGQDGSMGHGKAPNGELSQQQRRLLTYVRAHTGQARVPLAVEGGAMSASAYIIGSDLTVVGMGGFGAQDNAPSVAQLTAWKNTGQLGFVLLAKDTGSFVQLPGPGRRSSMPDPADEPRNQREQWVRRNCTLVDPTAYGNAAGSSEPLYDCE